MSEYPLDWSISNLGAYIQETKERAGDSDATPYSVSKVLGIVPQSEKFNKRVASSNTSNYKVIREGDFAYDPMLLWDGSINRMLRDEKGAVSPAYVTFKVSSGSLNPDYLLHLLKAETTKNFYKSISKGTNVRRQKAEFSDFAAGEFAFPPLPEQKRIAEILSGIDKVIESRRNKIHSSELLKKALTLRHVESIEDGIEEAKLGDLIHSIDSGWSPDCLKRPPLSDSEWSVLKTTSVTWKGFDPQQRKALPSNLPPKKELVVEAEDILITRAGPADRTGVVAYAEKKAINTMISDKIIRLRCDKSIIEPRFLSIFLGTDYAQIQMLRGKVGMASSQTNISQQLLREMRIRFPALKEQRRISEIVTELQKTINQIQRSIEQTEKLKQSISIDLLSGRKRVSV